MKTFLFVYGTLKRHGALNGYLQQDRFVEDVETEPGYILCSLGWYPGMIRDGNSTVKGELWEIDPARFPLLDDVEGSDFQRETIRLKSPAKNSEAEAYLYVGEPTNKQLDFWEV